MSFKIAPRATAVQTWQDLRAKVDEAVIVINGAMAGKINAVNNPAFPLTLTAGAGSTVLTDTKLTINSVVMLDPVTANAAAELAAGTIYALAADRRDGQWTFTHANNGQTDRTFAYLIIG